MKKILSFLLLFMAVMVFATWQYRLLCLLLFILLNRKCVHDVVVLVTQCQSAVLVEVAVQ